MIKKTYVSKKTGKKYTKVFFSPKEKIQHFSNVARKDSVKKNGQAYSEAYRNRARGYIEANKDSAAIFKKQHPRYKRKTVSVDPVTGEVK